MLLLYSGKCNLCYQKGTRNKYLFNIICIVAQYILMQAYLNVYDKYNTFDG